MKLLRAAVASVVAAVAACEFNEEINVAPQSLADLAALGACPQDGPGGDPASSLLDLVVLSDLDRLVEEGSRVSRGPGDNCTVYAGESDDADACRLSIDLCDATVRARGDMGDGAPAGIDAGTLRWCDANGACGGDAGDGAPLHLGIVIDAGDGADADTQNARLAAAKNMIDPVLCGGGDVVPGCPFTAADEVRLWSLVGGSLDPEGSWTSDPETALGSVDSIQNRAMGGGAPIFDALAGEDGVVDVVSRRGDDGDGRAVVVIATDGVDNLSTATPEDVPTTVPIHVVSLATTPAIEADLRTVACQSGGSYRAVADPAGYASALRLVRYVLRGRWRVEASLGLDDDGVPAGAGVYEISASATASVAGEDCADSPKSQLTFEVQR